MTERQDSPTPAICLLSGGIDSTTVLAIAQSEGYAVHCLSFDYGQRHRAELAAARRVAQALGAASHQIVNIDLRAFGGSALTDELAVPKDRPLAEMSHGIPVTYVPARNTIFLSFALAAAEVRGAFDLFLGVNAVDYSGYPDCRPEYIAAFEKMANLATKAGVEGRGRYKIHSPLIALTKADIIRTGSRLGVDYGLTHSCYDPQLRNAKCGMRNAELRSRESGVKSQESVENAKTPKRQNAELTAWPKSPDHPIPRSPDFSIGHDPLLTRGVSQEEVWLACGRCDSCLIRRRGFVEAGLPDPTEYVKPR